MPITMEYVRGRTDFRFTKVTGEITDADITRYQESLLHLQSLGDVLVDMRAADLSKVTSFTIVKAARNMSSPTVLGEARRVALVVPTDEAYGLMRMFQAIAENAPSTVRLFRDYAQAAQWIEFGESPVVT